MIKRRKSMNVLLKNISYKSIQGIIPKQRSLRAEKPADFFVKAILEHSFNRKECASLELWQGMVPLLIQSTLPHSQADTEDTVRHPLSA